MAWDGKRRSDGVMIFEETAGKWAVVTPWIGIDPLRPGAFSRCPCCGADIPSDHRARMIVDRLWPEADQTGSTL